MLTLTDIRAMIDLPNEDWRTVMRALCDYLQQNIPSGGGGDPGGPLPGGGGGTARR